MVVETKPLHRRRSCKQVSREINYLKAGGRYILWPFYVLPPFQRTGAVTMKNSD